MSDLQARIARYYTQALERFGASPRGVDWNSEESQIARFVQLARAIPRSGAVRVLDYGCGYGAFYDFLRTWNPQATYLGFDLSDAMIASARTLHPDGLFTAMRSDVHDVDVVVASGIFNVRMDVALDAWEDYVFRTLDDLFSLAGRAVAFNMLTKYSDRDRMKDTLYYADPELVTAHCRERFGRWVSMLSDYGLYEFTIVCAKEPLTP